jgi:CcmD family protein
LKEVFIHQQSIENLKVKRYQLNKIKSTLTSKILLFIVVLFSKNLYAQEINAPIEMADIMRSNGKIYVVVGVILIIFLGITSYLFLLNKKINKLEEKLKNNQ